MKFQFSIFNKTIALVVTIVPRDPEAYVVDLLRREATNFGQDVSRKIAMIKILRRPEVSKILIDAGLVPSDDIRFNDDGSRYIGLKTGKEFVDRHF